MLDVINLLMCMLTTNGAQLTAEITTDAVQVQSWGAKPPTIFGGSPTSTGVIAAL